MSHVFSSSAKKQRGLALKKWKIINQTIVASWAGKWSRESNLLWALLSIKLQCSRIRKPTLIWAENMQGSFFVEKIIFLWDWKKKKKNFVFVFNWVFENGSKKISCHFACSKIMNISYKHASGNIGCTKEFRDLEGEGTRKW